jgi:hypothetical protein
MPGCLGVGNQLPVDGVEDSTVVGLSIDGIAA